MPAEHHAVEVMQCLGDPVEVIVRLCYKTDQVHFHNSRHLCKFPGTASHGAPCPLKGTEGLSILLWK